MKKIGEDFIISKLYKKFEWTMPIYIMNSHRIGYLISLQKKKKKIYIYIFFFHIIIMDIIFKSD